MVTLRRSTRSTRGHHSNPDRDVKSELRADNDDKAVADSSSNKQAHCSSCQAPLDGASGDGGDSVYTCTDCNTPEDATNSSPTSSSTSTARLSRNARASKTRKSSHSQSPASGRDHSNDDDDNGNDGEYQDNDDHNAKRRRVSQEKVTATTKEDPNDKVRTPVVKALAGVLLPIVKRHCDDLGLKDSQSLEDYAQELSVQVERALFDHLGELKDPFKKNSKKIVGQKYREKFRSLTSNLKDAKNVDFGKRVATKAVQPAELVQLSSEEMMNPELQALAEKVREESIRNSTIVANDTGGTRIRRTHKGEEIIEVEDDSLNQDDSFATPTFMPMPRERPETPKESKNDDKKGWSGNDGGDGAARTSTTPESNNNDSPPPAAHQTNFHTTAEDMFGASSPESNYDGVEDDEELDLSDGENPGDELQAAVAPAWKETEFWNNQVEFTGLSNFQAHAFHLSSTDQEFDQAKQWDGVFDAGKMLIDGRLDLAKAQTYLENVSATKDLAAFILAPESNDDSGFNTFFDYFDSRSKAAVIKNRRSNIKDAYLWALHPTTVVPPCLGLSVDGDAWLKGKFEQYPKLVLGVLVVNEFKPSTSTPSNTMATTHHKPAAKPNGHQSQSQQPPPMPLDFQQLGLSQQDVGLLQTILQDTPGAAQDPQLLIKEIQRRQMQSY